MIRARRDPVVRDCLEHASGLGDQLLCCLFITGMARTGNQILAKTLHLY